MIPFTPVVVPRDEHSRGIVTLCPDDKPAQAAQAANTHNPIFRMVPLPLHRRRTGPAARFPRRDAPRRRTRTSADRV
jgi:hypothetical protein